MGDPTGQRTLQVERAPREASSMKEGSHQRPGMVPSGDALAKCVEGACGTLFYLLPPCLRVLLHHQYHAWILPCSTVAMFSLYIQLGGRTPTFNSISLYCLPQLFAYICSLSASSSRPRKLGAAHTTGFFFPQC